MISKIITHLLNFIHLILVIFPVCIYFLNKKKIKKYVKYLLLLSFLTPTHWYFFENQCISSVIAKKIGYKFDEQNEAPFTETYLVWLYKPIMKQIGWKWNEEGITKMSALHWTINFILCWYYCFFY